MVLVCGSPASSEELLAEISIYNMQLGMAQDYTRTPSNRQMKPENHRPFVRWILCAAAKGLPTLAVVMHRTIAPARHRRDCCLRSASTVICMDSLRHVLALGNHTESDCHQPRVHSLVGVWVGPAPSRVTTLAVAYDHLAEDYHLTSASTRQWWPWVGNALPLPLAFLFRLLEQLCGVL